MTIYSIYAKFKETGIVLDKERFGHHTFNIKKLEEFATYFKKNLFRRSPDYYGRYVRQFMNDNFQETWLIRFQPLI